MFDKLKYLFSFKWFYIALFLFLSIFNFWEEILVGRETIKFVFQNQEQIKNVDYTKNKINFIDEYEIPLENDLVIYDKEIQYIFLHPLISDIGLQKEIRTNKKNIFNLFITVDEFKKCLDILYEQNYILVDIYDIYKQTYKEERFKIERQDLKIPKGKKPLVLFIDDLSYNRHMSEYTSSKLVIDELDNKIKSVVNYDGHEVISDDMEIIPIINNFIELHPDFSFNNARGVISLTGYEGVFGYNTGKNVRRDSKNLEVIRRLSKDIFDAQKVANKLKEEGWIFACHTYGHINLKNFTLDYIKNDMENWFKYVANIVGDTNIFVYPYDYLLDKDDERFKYLNNNGFNIFCFSNKGLNKDIFTVKDYVYIHRDLISFQTIKSNKKDFYKNFQGVINSNKIEKRKKINMLRKDL